MEGHMNMFLNNCSKYVKDWKIEFNPDKSPILNLNSREKTEFSMNGRLIPECEGLIYLGLPLGDDKFNFKFFEAGVLICF